MGWPLSTNSLSACFDPLAFIGFLFWNSEVEAMKLRPLHDRVVVRRIEEDK
jgi:hypothetical protein